MSNSQSLCIPLTMSWICLLFTWNRTELVANIWLPLINALCLFTIKTMQWTSACFHSLFSPYLWPPGCGTCSTPLSQQQTILTMGKESSLWMCEGGVARALNKKHFHLHSGVLWLRPEYHVSPSWQHATTMASFLFQFYMVFYIASAVDSLPLLISRAPDSEPLCDHIKAQINLQISCDTSWTPFPIYYDV